MGFWGKILAHSAGAANDITCQTCGTVYRSNIDRRFPYAICGRCLEREQDRAAENGDRDTCNIIEWEFRRRQALL